ncbi:hypothetical protein VP1G_10432 [Cytospora mali]|uniref:Uncharacterized protein n=1 Tax=Cytospora mali TaxID=578113 RepID=A0A194VHN2_CYTMA|nr:hypothetical protein VP1G_10432 [Valsa mali var. pyri (nom. inval.)]
MSAGAIPPSRPAAKGADPPQYASFDTSKKEEGEDSLPAMPTWEDSESKKVVLEEEVVELQQLKKPETNGQGQPLMNGMSPSPSPGPNTPNGPGPRSPYGPQGNQAAANGYMGPGPRGPGSRGPGGPPGAGAMPNPYGMQQGQGYNQMSNGYAQSQATFHTEQSWGVTGGQDYGQMPAPSPTGYDQPDYSPPPTNAPGYFDQGAYSEYGGTGNGPVPPVMNQPYGMGAEPPQAQQPQPQRRGPPRGALGAVGGAAMPDRSRGSPAPQQEPGFTGGQLDQPPLTYSPSPVQGGFSPAPERSFSPAPQRTFSPAPQQGFSPVPPQRAFSPAPPQRAFSPAPQRTFSPAPQQGFPSGPQRNFSPAPQRQYSADSAPGPGRGPMPPRGAPRGPPRGPPYRQFSADSAPNPQRQFSGDSAGRPLVGGLAGRPPPQRQFTADMARPPQSPGPQNNGGFDFQSGFSRPSRTNTFDSAGGDQPEQSGAYPGYKPYQPGR